MLFLFETPFNIVLSPFRPVNNGKPNVSSMLFEVIFKMNYTYDAVISVCVRSSFTESRVHVYFN